MFDKHKDSFYKGHRIPKDILALLQGDLKDQTVLWDLDLPYPAFATVDDDLREHDEYTITDDVMFFLDDEKIEYTDHEYFNKERGLIVTIFELPNNGRLIYAKIRWEIYKDTQRETMNF